MKAPINSLLLTLAVLAFLPRALAEPAIDKMAHDGYWLQGKPAQAAAMEMLNKPAPALSLTGWHGQKPEQANKITVIDFWATWCGPCLAQIPHANEIAKKYADKGVVVFGGCCPDGADTMAKVAKEHKMEYATGKLDKSEVKNWNISFWPTYAIIDRAGKVRAIGLEPGRVEPLLEALIAEQPAKK